MKVHIQSVAAVGLLTLLPACSSDDDGSGKPVDLKVGFGVSATIAQEDASYLEVDVVLNRPSGSVLVVDFFTTGDALEPLDFQMLTSTPLEIPAGAVSTNIRIQIFEDTFGEKDEVVDLTLMTPIGGSLGAISTHRLTISDEDAQPFAEAEPNNDFATSNVVGAIQEGLSYRVTGNLKAAFGEYDVFQLTASDNSDVFIQLNPDNYVSEMRFHILDDAGLIIFTYAGSAGEAVSTEYEAVQGEVFHVATWVEAADTDYQLDLVGLASTLTSNGGPGSGASELTRIGRSFGIDLDGFRAWLEAKSQAEALDGSVTDEVILTVVTEN